VKKTLQAACDASGASHVLLLPLLPLLLPLLQLWLCEEDAASCM
jgi:hypothetical protein